MIISTTKQICEKEKRNENFITKNLVAGLNSRINTAEERIRKHEDRAEDV